MLDAPVRRRRPREGKPPRGGSPPLLTNDAPARPPFPNPDYPDNETKKSATRTPRKVFHLFLLRTPPTNPIFFTKTEL